MTHSRRRAALTLVLAGLLSAALVLGDGAVPGSSPAAPAHAAAKPLKKGAHGPRVRKLQRLLRIRVDGAFGTATLRALKRFQKRHGLTVDGVAGPATMRALRARARARRAGARRGHGPRVPRARVRAVQRLLGLPVDGVFGPQTKRAVRRFQRRHGLTVDGVPGPRTMAALRRARSGRHRGGRRAHRRKVGVRWLQRRLHLRADGVFGPRTRRAVVRFQRRHGLRADGIVGPATWRALGVKSNRVLKMRSRRRGHRGAMARLIRAANRIARRPYQYGGGHASFVSYGYDCSGSLSYALRAAGLLRSPLDSSGFMRWGRPGRGRRVTIYANPGHAFMVVNGRRYDTSAMRETGGSRWTRRMRSTSGYVARHPAGW